MNKLLTMIIIPLMIIACDTDQPTTVDNVNLERYMGKWYAVSNIPPFFQRQCVSDVTAEYSLIDDGVEVKNTCLTADGSESIIIGFATPADDTNAKLKVQFPGAPVAGDYWILSLDEEYEFANVGDPSRTYGWVLSRYPDATDEEIEEQLDKFEAKGYDRSEFVKVEHAM